MQLTEISDSMLDYANISSGNVQLKNGIIKIKDVILQVNQNISLKAQEKNQQYNFSTKNLTKHYFYGDGLRLALIYQNIMENAVKFTPNGGRIDVDIEETEIDFETVRLSFVCKDNGKGMSEEFVKKINTAFHQSDEAYSRTHGGLGLGLFLTQFFVKLMKGTFDVESKEGVGSTFTITFDMKCPSIEKLIENNIKCQPVRTIAFEDNEEYGQKAKGILKTIGVKAELVDSVGTMQKKIRARLGSPYEYAVAILNVDSIKNYTDLIDEIHELAPGIQMHPLSSRQ